MELLYELDQKNYAENLPVNVRYCIRGIIIRDGRVAMQKGSAGDYKILGGGMEAGEDPELALSREVEEESGLIVKQGSLVPIGRFFEKRRDLYDARYIYELHTMFYFCSVEERTTEPHMTISEKAKGYHLVWASPEEILESNRAFTRQPWIVRDSRMIQMLLDRGYFGETEIK